MNNLNTFTIKKLFYHKQTDNYKQNIEKMLQLVNTTELQKISINKSSIVYATNKQIEDILENLCAEMFPYIENNIYNGYKAQIIESKLIYHIKSDKEYDIGQFLWHRDNHIPEILNVMILLSDVNESCGEMEYLSKNNEIIVYPYQSPSGGILFDPKLVNNYDINKCTGVKGDVFVFNNCIIHRASTPKKQDRTVILLQIIPRKSIDKYFDSSVIKVSNNKRDAYVSSFTRK